MRLRRKIKRIIIVAAVIGLLLLLGVLVVAADPVSFALNNTSVSEGLPSGTAVGQFSLSDPEEENPIYTLADGVTDNQSFYIDGDTLMTGVSFDYEIKSAYSIVVDIRVDSGAAGQETFLIGIENVAPVAENKNLTSVEDASLTGALAASSGDLTSVTYQMTATTPAKGNVTIDPATGGFTYVPNENANGADSFSYEATDGVLSASAIVTININPVNDSPVNDQPPSFTGDMAVGGTLTATAGSWNDDADGNAGTLSYAYTWQSAADSGGTDTQVLGTGNTYVLTQDESKRYVRITMEVTDADASGAVTAQAVSGWSYLGNSAPEITETAPEISTLEDTPDTITLHAGDVDGDALTWSVSEQASGGEAVITGAGAVTYTPAENYFGSDSFTIAVEDDFGGQETVVVAVTVTSVNDAPANTALPAISGTAHNGQALTATAGSWNDAADGSAATTLNYACQWQSADTADGPWSDIVGAAGFSYTLTAGENGKFIRAKITCTDSDANPASTDAYSAAVEVVNTAPVITQGETASLTLFEDDAFASLGLDVTDADGDNVTWSITAEASLGTAAVTGESANSKTIVYIPDADNYGIDSFVVTVSDGNGGTDAITVNVTINPVNDVPFFTAGADQTVLEDCGAKTIESWIIASSTGAENETGQALTYHVTNDNNSLFSAQPSVSLHGTLTYTPAADMNGSAAVTLYVTDDGGIANDGVDTSAAQTFTITVTSVNDAPSFTKGDNQTVLEDAAAQTVTGWATAISTGPSDESGQTLSFNVTNNNNSLFSAQPSVSSDGTLTYTPALNANGTATVTVSLTDSGGVLNGGIDTSAIQTFTITITPVNDVPFFTAGADQTVLEDCGAKTIADWIASVSPGAANETDQTLTYHVTNNNNSLFSTQPSVSPDGTLTYTPAADMNGSATVTLYVTDDGGIANDSVDTSAAQTFTITVTAVNDAPSFTKGDNQTVLEDAAAQTVTGWATAISTGPSDESGQTLSFNVTNNNNSLFSAQPSVSSDGTLTYTPALNANGTATVTVSLTDSGGVLNGGIDTSAIRTFTITITPVNDVPSFTAGADQTVLEDCGAKTIPGWIASVSPGAANETDQTLTYHVTNNNNSLFSTQPSVSPDGTLTYTPAADMNGSATVTLYVTDDGGIANDSVDTSAAQTFTITVTAVNDAPSFTKGDNQTVLEDAAAQTVTGWATAISTGPSDESGQTLSFNVTNNNNSLFSAQPSVSSDGTLTYTPALNANGTATVTVSLTDSGGVLNGGIDTSAIRTFTITITPVNDVPTFTGDESLTTDEDTPYVFSFTIDDVEDDPGTLAITYTTNNTALLPKTNMTLGGAGSDRTLTLTPVSDRSGSVDITVTVTDSAGDAVTHAATLTVTAVNDAPELSDITDRTVDEDTSTGAIGYTISDVDSDVGVCTVTVTSDNETLVPNDSMGIVLGGSGASRTITISPAGNQSGTANITVTADDNSGSATATDTIVFTVTVTAVNDAPAISAIDDLEIDEDGTTGTIAFTVSDVDNAASQLTVTAATDNTAMIPRANITLGGDEGARTIVITPVANDSGTANFTVTVKDPGGKLATETFVLTVAAVNDAPVLLAVSSQSVNEDTTKNISVYVSDIDNDLAELALTATASTNTDLLPLDNIAVTGSTGTRTVSMTPAADASGTTDVTLTLTDGAGGTVKRTFTLTVNSVNDLPSFTPGADVTVAEDCGGQTVSAWATNISTGADNEAQTLTFLIATDNDGLFSALPAISAETGDLTFTPAADANGEAIVTTRLQDGGGGLSAVRTFTITVTPVNDTPVSQNMTVGLDTDEDQYFKGALRVTDVDGDALTYELVSGETHGVTEIDTDHGSVTLNSSTGTFIYTPDGNYYGGTDAFYFRVYDGTVYSEAATVTIHITGVNDAPTAANVGISVSEDGSYTGTLDSVTDVDGPEISYELTKDVQNGTLSLGSSGSVTYTPDPDYYGTDRFTYRAFDGYIYSNTATVTITVSSVNDAPVAADETINLDEGQTLHGVFKASDIEQDALTYSIVSQPASGTLTLTNSSTGAYTYEPADMGDAATVTVTFTFRAEDPGAAADTGTVTVVITNINNPPENEGAPPIEFTVAEDGTLTGNVYASDPDGDALTYSVVSSVSHGTLSNFDASDGSFTYEPHSNFNGTDRFTFEASDGEFYTSIYMAVITVTGVNDAPVAYAQLYETAQDTAITDIILVGFDPDGNSLTYQIASDPSHGALSDNGDGTYTYTPAECYTGMDSFTYTATDSLGAVSAEATVTIHINGEGSGGGLGDIANQTMPQDSTKTLALTITDITVQSVTAVSSNTWLLDAGGITVNENAGTYSLELEPNSYRTGRTVVTVTVTDSDTNTHSRSFILTVTRVNYAPECSGKELTIDENKQMYEFVTGSDLNGDSLTFAASQPSNGTLTFNPNGTFRYVPAANFSGDDSFTFTVTDIDNVASAPATFTIHVRLVDVPPTAVGDSFETDEDTPCSGTLTGTEAHDQALTYHLVSSGSLGTAVITDADTGAFTYTPDENEFGTDVFTFKVMGPTGLYSNVASVTVTVNAVNDAPTAVVTPVSTYEDQAVSGYLEGTDVEESPLTYILTSVEGGGSLTKGSLTVNADTGYFTYTPDENVNGTDYFCFKVNDGAADSEIVQINVTIAAVNDAPAALDCSVGTTEDTAVTDSVSAFYEDVDGDAQAFTVIQAPSKGTIVFNENGTYTFTPAANVNGTDYFTFKTQDSGGLNSNVALVTVTITPVNDAPVITAEETWTINEDSAGNTFNFTVSDIEDDDGTLTLSGSWDETEIAAVAFGGSGDSRTMVVTPVDDFQSETEITVTVTDSGIDGTVTGDVKTDSVTVTVTVSPVNDTPTINDHESNGTALSTTVTIDEDTSTAPLAFTVGDEESGPDALTITAASNNTTLVPLSGITFGGSGANRTVTVTPAADKYGTVRITVYVSDGNSTRNAYFYVTVLPVNDAPVVLPPDEQTIPEDGSTEILYYTISDIDNDAADITMSAASSDAGKVASIVLAGNGAERTVKVVPAANASGDVTITLTADDGEPAFNTGTGTFVVHVTPVNDAPAISAIDNQTILEDGATGQIAVTIDDIDNALSELTLSAVSGNPDLIDTDGIVFGTNEKTGARWMTLTPKADANGSALITVKVTDSDGKYSQKSFTLTVTPVNDAPTISAIADQTILEDTSTNTITFTVGDIDNDVTTLAVTGAADGTVIPNDNIVFVGNGAERTVKVTPAADQNGSIEVTLTVTDPGELFDTSTFTVNITPVNDAPSFTAGADQEVSEDCGTQTVAGWATNISKGPDNESGQTLTFHLGHTNAGLFASGGAPAVDASGQLTYTPADDAYGTSTVTIYLKDDGGTDNGGDDDSDSVTFTITVLPVNDQPVFTDAGDITVNEDSGAYSGQWANTASIDVGPINETQTHTFSITDTAVTSVAGNTSLFSVAPAIDASTGEITFTPALNASGTATVTVVLRDDDGTENGGVDTSEDHTFTITVTPVNDAPTYTLGGTVTVDEDSGAYTNATYATGITTGGGTDESDETLTFTLSGYDASLFASVPVLTTGGQLTFTPAADAHGTTTVTVVLSDGTNDVTKTFDIVIRSVNDAPSFTAGADQEVSEDCGAQTIPGWATNISKGPDNESGQTLTFHLGHTNAGLFASGGAPAVDASGQLTYTPADDAYGTSTVTIYLKDDGGTDNGGDDDSDSVSFTITVLSVNDQPVFTDTGDITVNEDSGGYSEQWATTASIDVGPTNETQTHTFSITNTTVTSVAGNTNLFSVAPAIDASTGEITFTPAGDANGTATVTVVLRDDDGTANGGVDTSIDHTFIITVTPVNDAPTYTLGGTVTVDEDSGAYTNATYATGITTGGGTDESDETLTFTLSGYDASLFASVPVLTTGGQLTFTPADDAYGTTTVTVVLSDGTNDVTKTFDIVIRSVNDQPVFTDAGDITVNEDSGAYSGQWVNTASIDVGPTNETQTHTFSITNTAVTSVAGNTNLFSVAPAIDASTGAVTFTPALNASGTATVTVVLRDDDGTANGGVDTSEDHTFTITVTPVNDAPTYTLGGTVTVDEDSGAYTNATYATGITTGGGTDESTQTLTFTLSGYDASLFASVPVLTTGGQLTFTPAADAHGTTTVTVVLSDGTNDVTKTFDIVIRSVNDAPSFTAGTDQEVSEDCGTQTVQGWATDISKGPDNESGQTLTFHLGHTNAGLFAIGGAPAVDASGQLTYTPAADAYGTSTVTIYLEDDGGTDNGGDDDSDSVSFTITVLPVNDQPVFTDAGDITVNEDSGAYSGQWVNTASIDVGPTNETQTHTFSITNTAVTSVAGNTNLFSVAPAIDASTGAVTFTPALNASGTATVTVVLRDDDGTANGGVDTSEDHTFTITVTPVNDAPTYTLGGTVTVDEDSGAYTNATYVTGITTGGGTDESTQTLTFTLSGYDASLFASVPVLTTGGQLTFTPAADAYGTTTVSVKLSDGTNDVTKTFDIVIRSVNDAPSFTAGADQEVSEDCGTQTVAGWATNISKGPSNESGQTLSFHLGHTNAGLFASGGAPAVDASGQLTYTPADDAYGTSTVTIYLQDDGGTDYSGDDDSGSVSFTITVLSVNDQPVFTDTGNITVNEDSGGYSGQWVNTASIDVGPTNETQTHTFSITDTAVTSVAGNTNLFSAAPAIDASTGEITFTPALNANGTATVTVVLRDDDGTANGGVDTSISHTFTITVTPVNDVPAFEAGSDLTVGENTGAKTITGWATEVSKGPSDESGQTLTFVITTDNDGVFAVTPAVSADGTLTFTPAAAASGTATVSVTLKDDGGTAFSGVDTSPTKQFTVTVVGSSQLVLTGTVRDAETNAAIDGASVYLLDLDGNEITSATTGADGVYRFDNLSVGKYTVKVRADGYNDNSRVTDVSFENNATGTITEDFLLAKFYLELSADPTEILGDGKDEAVLTATVTDSEGNPISGVTLTFYSEKGSFKNGVAAADTGADGTAEVVYISEDMSGVDIIEVPVTVSVNDEARKLYGTAAINVTFAPGFVEGTVTDGNSNTPVEGAVVTVYNDDIGFIKTQVTGSDGRYRIALPKGNVDYSVKITKKTEVGGVEYEITVEEEVKVDDIGTGDEIYKPSKSATGIVILEQTDGSTCIQDDLTGSGMKLEIEDENGNKAEVGINEETGVFRADGLSVGTYELYVTYEMEDGSTIIVGSTEITITEDGELNISQVLIDPYGTITDKSTGAVISGVNVELYYADTARNKAAGLTPGTLVPLPLVAGFSPANNANPQSSDANGKYAFMVFPQTDYYIVAAKAGYTTYTSATISVYTAIVRHDFQMSKSAVPGGGTSSTDTDVNEHDLAVEIESEAMKVEEGGDVTLTVRYMNKSDTNVSEATITVTVPYGLTVKDSGGGTVTGSRIIWTVEDLAPDTLDSLSFVLEAGPMYQKERRVEIYAAITGTGTLINPEDDTSFVYILLYSNRFEGLHERYIKGYEDGTFKAGNNITRAETAAVFARLLDLDVTSSQTGYHDVPAGHWAARYIQAVSKIGLMNGYEDGTFGTDAPITRAEFATIIARYFLIERDNSVLPLEMHFTDIADSWAMSTIEEVRRMHIINGYEDGTFKPGAYILRCEAVTIINRMLYRGPIDDGAHIFPDVPEGSWYCGQVEEASKTHKYTINADGSETVTQWIDDDLV